MSVRWIVVADQTLARIFSMNRLTAPLTEVESLVHPEGRLHEGQMVSDRPGRGNVPGSAGRHAVENDVRRKEASTEAFAREIAARLDRARHENLFEKLAIVAPPRMLGLIRKELTAQTSERVDHEVAKEIARLEPATIRTHLNDVLVTHPA